MCFLRQGLEKFADDGICVLFLDEVEWKVENSPWEEGIILPVVDSATFESFSSRALQ